LTAACKDASIFSYGDKAARHAAYAKGAREEFRMFRYFKDSQMLSQGVLLALNAEGEINEIERTLRKVSVESGIPEITSWFNAWTELGNLLLSQAADDLTSKRRISAAHKFRRASVYFGLCERYIPHTDPRKAQS
jgi:hypothetical protein